MLLLAIISLILKDRIIDPLVVPIRYLVCCFDKWRAYNSNRLLHRTLLNALACSTERRLVFVDWAICIRIDLVNQKLLLLLLTSIEPSIAKFTINRASCRTKVLCFLP